MAKKPRTPELPGMEGVGRIPDLHAKALEYASARDARMEALETEVGLKGELLDLMKKHKKTTYMAEGLDIEIVPTGEKLRVRVHKSADDEEDAA